MDPVIALREDRLQVEPGDQVIVSATIRNPGTLVEQYELQVLGLAASWAEALPAEVSLAPGAEADVQLLFRPPLDSNTPAGQVPFGFRCVSREDPQRCEVVEGDLTVGAIIDLEPRLVVVQGEGRWSGDYRIEFDNHGTVPMHLELEAADERNALSFALVPTLLEVPEGGRAEAYLRVRTRRPFLLGTVKQHPFTVRYRRVNEDGRPGGGGSSGPGGGENTGTVGGTFEQRPIASKALVILAGLVLAAVAALLALAARSGGAAPAGALAPPPPTVESATATGPDRVQLIWPSNALASAYKVQKLLAGRPADEPVPEAEAEVAGGLTVHTWEGLAPGAEHCFRLVAANDAGSSDPSAPVCATTFEQAPFGPPTGLEATPLDGGQVQLRWQPSDPAAQHVIFLNGTRLVDVQPGGAQATVAVPGSGEHCFTVLGQLGDQASVPSEERCVTVEGAPDQAGEAAGTQPGGGPPGGPPGAGTPGAGGTPPEVATPTPGAGPGGDVEGFYAIYDVFPIDDIVNEDRAQRRVAELQAAAVPAKLLDSRESDELFDGIAGLWVVYWDGFPTREQALAHCDTYRPQAPSCFVPR